MFPQQWPWPAHALHLDKSSGHWVLIATHKGNYFSKYKYCSKSGYSIYYIYTFQKLNLGISFLMENQESNLIFISPDNFKTFSIIL